MTNSQTNVLHHDTGITPNESTDSLVAQVKQGTLEARWFEKESSLILRMPLRAGFEHKTQEESHNDHN